MKCKIFCLLFLAGFGCSSVAAKPERLEFNRYDKNIVDAYKVIIKTSDCGYAVSIPKAGFAVQNGGRLPPLSRTL